jgi:hypothetical protein
MRPETGSLLAHLDRSGRQSSMDANGGIADIGSKRTAWRIFDRPPPNFAEALN